MLRQAGQLPLQRHSESGVPLPRRQRHQLGQRNSSQLDGERDDAVVVGSGPNGLAAALTLADAGLRVLVLEGSGAIGGGLRSAELTLPGFVHDVCSAIHPLAIGSPCLRQLPLAEHGLDWIHPPLPVAHPLDDGTAAVHVIGEVATAVLLLFGAGLLLRTLLAVESVDRGYRAESVLTMIVDPLGSRYPTEASRLQFYEAVEQETMSLPGVRGVAWATTLPLGRSYQGQSFFEVVGDPPTAESQRPAADYQIVSPTYFRTLDLPVVGGRGFDDRDTSDGVQVCIVNEAFVRGYLQGRSPIGQRVAIRPGASAPPVVREIVGVARQVKGRPNETEDLAQIYVPLAQDTPGDIFMVARAASGRAEALAPSVRAAIARVDTEQVVGVREVMTLEDVAWEATARHRFRAVLVMTFAGLALLLAMVGVFGILSYSVQQRVRELGVRRALGATTGDVLRLIVGSAVRVIVSGAVIGLVLAALLGRLLATILFGVEPLDLMTFASVTIVLALTAAVAIAGPAWLAARINPASALRGE